MHVKKVRQQGFTLIELMVVVVIIAVVVTAGVLSLGPSEQAQIRAQETKLKSLLTFVRDQSTFDQKLYLVSPDKQGLTTYVLLKGKWQPASKVAFLPWQEGVKTEWTVDLTFAHQQQLPKAGWMVWPSGDILPGEVFIYLNESNSGYSKDKSLLTTVRWNGLLQFESVD